MPLYVTCGWIPNIRSLTCSCHGVQVELSSPATDEPADFTNGNIGPDRTDSDSHPSGHTWHHSRHRRQTPSSYGPQNANILYWQAFHQSIMIALTLHLLPALPHCLVTSSTPQRFPQQAHPKTSPTIWMVYPFRTQSQGAS